MQQRPLSMLHAVGIANVQRLGVIGFFAKRPEVYIKSIHMANSPSRRAIVLEFDATRLPEIKETTYCIGVQNRPDEPFDCETEFNIVPDFDKPQNQILIRRNPDPADPSDYSFLDEAGVTANLTTVDRSFNGTKGFTGNDPIGLFIKTIDGGFDMIDVYGDLSSNVEPKPWDHTPPRNQHSTVTRKELSSQSTFDISMWNAVVNNDL